MVVHFHWYSSENEVFCAPGVSGATLHPICEKKNVVIKNIGVMIQKDESGRPRGKLPDKIPKEIS